MLLKTHFDLNFISFAILLCTQQKNIRKHNIEEGYLICKFIDHMQILSCGSKFANQEKLRGTYIGM